MRKNTGWLNQYVIDNYQPFPREVPPDTKALVLEQMKQHWNQLASNRKPAEPIQQMPMTGISLNQFELLE